MEAETPHDPYIRSILVRDLFDFFQAEKLEVHGAKGLPDYPAPPFIQNAGFNDTRPRQPDIIGLDTKAHRIAFGIIREQAADLATEDSLAEYNVFLDHNAHKGDRASVLYVMIPANLLQDFTRIITHYIHREYWNRIIPVPSSNVPAPGLAAP
jgi:hypothetical protein